MSDTPGVRINRALLRMYVIAEGPSVDTRKDRIDTGKAAASPPKDYHSMYDEWRERVERLVIAMEDAVEAHTKGQHYRPQTTFAELRKRIHKYEGRDIVWVAFLEKCSTDLVRKVRVGAGLDGSTGLRKERPLTAPPPKESDDPS